jgi:hypothetical protein
VLSDLLSGRIDLREVIPWLLEETVVTHVNYGTDELRNNALDFKWKVFDGHFEYNSEYQGPPDENLTARWTSISRLYNLAADYTTLRQANKTKGLVNWPGTDTYMVGLEAFHHLHCLVWLAFPIGSSWLQC